MACGSDAVEQSQGRPAACPAQSNGRAACPTESAQLSPTSDSPTQSNRPPAGRAAGPTLSTRGAKSPAIGGSRRGRTESDGRAVDGEPDGEPDGVGRTSGRRQARRTERWLDGVGPTQANQVGRTGGRRPVRRTRSDGRPSDGVARTSRRSDCESTQSSPSIGRQSNRRCVRARRRSVRRSVRHSRTDGRPERRSDGVNSLQLSRGIH